MADYYQQIAAPEVPDDAVGDTADRLIDRLLQLRAIAGNTDRTAGTGGSFQPGDGAETVLQAAPGYDWRRLRKKEIEVVTSRTVFWNLDPASQSVCPACGYDNGPDFFEAYVFPVIDAWYSGDDGVTVTCHRCRQPTRLPLWHFDPPWAFATLGLTFWNWPRLGEGFVADLGDIVGSRLVYLSGKL